MNEFYCLIEILHKAKNQEEIKCVFSKIAIHLMNELCINTDKEQYRIVDCEIYYNVNKIHNDPYPYGFIKNKSTPYKKYCFKKQKEKLHWFFHYAGVDLTIGVGDESDIFGGILIRAIEQININGEEFIDGPLKLKDILLNTQNDAFSPSIHLYLCGFKYESELSVKSCIRFGLDKEKRKEEIQDNTNFYKEKYHYVIEKYYNAPQFKTDLKKNCIEYNLACD